MTLSSAREAAHAPPRRIRIDSRRRWFPDLRELFRYQQLIVLFGRRDITVKYRQTLLGTIWVFTGPLVSAGLFSFVFGRVADLPSGGAPYFVFAYAGLLSWNLFSSSLSGASGSMTGNSGLITKIYFPRLVIPLSTLASTLVNTAISFGVMLGLLLISGVGVSLHILVLPAWMFLALVLATGIGLFLTSVAISYRDVNYATPLFTQLLLYLSPVAYSADAVPSELRSVYLLNPLTTIIEGTRWSLVGHGELRLWAIGYTVAVTAGVLLFGLMTFSHREGIFADVV